MPFDAASVWYSENPGLGSNIFWPSFARHVMHRSMAPEHPLAITTSVAASGASGLEYFSAIACRAASYPTVRKGYKVPKEGGYPLDLKLLS